MNMTRREFFIGGAAFGALGAFAGNRFFAAAGFKAGSKPRLRMGVLSDIHVVRAGLDEAISAEGNSLTFRRALEWFRSQDVDAVAITGDIADLGNDVNLMAVSDAWYSVFPDDKHPDGRRVEKIFVSGNHDWYGDSPPNARIWPDKAECAKHVIKTNMAYWWEKAFHEAYEPIWRKEVNGYAFIGCHWDEGGFGREAGRSVYPFARIKEWMAKNGVSLDPSLPFFYLQHPHLKNTCYGPWAWGRDKGVATKTLSAFPNAIAFSGHSHYSLTDERSIWQGAFTSVGCSSLRYQSSNYDEFPPAGFENWTGGGGREGWRANANKFLKKLYCGDSRQGMLWSVYDDCIVVRKREFLSGADIGLDWVLPLPAAESRPFAFAERAKKFRAPQFPENAALKIERTRARNRGGRQRGGTGMVEAVEQDAFNITAPSVVKDNSARAQYYEFVAVRADGGRVVKRVLPPSFHHALSNWRKMKAPVSCIFGAGELGGGMVRFEVAGVNCFGTKGAALAAETDTAKGETRT